MYRTAISLRILAELSCEAEHSGALSTIPEARRERDAVLTRTTSDIDVGHEQRVTAIYTLRPHAHRHRVTAIVVDVEFHICDDDTRVLHRLCPTLEDDVVIAGGKG